ncbi:site-2 protease family protein [Streptomyces silvensis]|uniref:Peptidase M50 domain-containing protein n=1 Tax=Streptomyces silvensis TaxID=1765722 RepID=A0A0W7WQQ0_9ACTN|nr:site-2 protease family protein [Streptomyces silvensis]KUF12896.1 hypothetical protein AT728_40045 [Streptomyces silvensis]
MHWSALLAAALVASALARERLPRAFPGEPVWTYWGLGSVMASLFLVSLLIHEMAHVLVARRSGVVVDGAVLWALGGSTRFRGAARDPDTQLRIAGAGPLTSLTAALLSTGGAVCAAALSVPGPVGECVIWCATVNFVLAVFNGLPAAPLDGGRVLWAYLRHRGMDPVRAARAATTGSSLLGWFMLLTGLASLLLAGTLMGVWPTFVGLFLITVARTARQRS